MLYFDCAGGAAGDMILAALIGAGASRERLIDGIEKLNIGAHAVIRETAKSGIRALSVAIETDDHHHAEDSHGHHSHRGLGAIMKMINDAALPDTVKENACAVFKRIAEAEAHVHGIPVEQIHFHEVGAIDSIADIVGAAILIDALKPSRILCSPVPSGHGEIKTQHGVLPNPAPATVEILRNMPTYRRDVAGELVTPTAAAIFAHYAGLFSMNVTGAVKAVGYGAGTKTFTGVSGLLRALIIDDNGNETVTARVLECNIDDMTPEALSHVLGVLMKNGADDAWLTPIVMKKGRPAYTLSMLTMRDDYSVFSDIMLRETTTLGLRIQPVDKVMLPREMKDVATEYGTVRVKIASAGGHLKMKPEFDDVQRIADERGVPFHRVYEAVIRAWKR
ncbi:MAG: nickel pincer cofactor biosynthesis protein LarC [Spirochaetes bacterium]|nr:nickel pincer cofactor biosynthesis protein LarC [Spirochaetota bacterium]